MDDKINVISEKIFGIQEIGEGMVRHWRESTKLMIRESCVIVGVVLLVGIP